MLACGAKTQQPSASRVAILKTKRRRFRHNNSYFDYHAPATAYKTKSAKLKKYTHAHKRTIAQLREKVNDQIINNQINHKMKIHNHQTEKEAIEQNTQLSVSPSHLKIKTRKRKA